MPRTRSNPEPIATVHYDAVSQFGMGMVYGDDMRVIRSKSKFVYVVDHVDASGKKIGQTVEEIAWGDLPKSVRKDLKAVYRAMLEHAEANGHIGSGTDDNDLS